MNRSSFYIQDAENMLKYKIIILGLSATGKTALLTRYQQNFYDDRTITTLSVDFNIIKRPKALYCYYDTAGQQVYRAIVSNYYKGADACIIVYDVSREVTFEEISYYYNQVKEHTEDSLIYIIGCKGDLQAKITPEDVTKKYKGIKQFVTSAKLDQGVKEAFLQIESDLLKRVPKLYQMRKSKLKSLFYQQQQTEKGKGKKGKSQCCKN